MPGEDFLDLVAEVALDFQNQASDAPVFLGGFVGENLIGEGIHAATGFAAADGPEDGNAGEQSALGNDEPVRVRCRYRFAGVVNLADNER